MRKSILEWTTKWKKIYILIFLVNISGFETKPNLVSEYLYSENSWKFGNDAYNTIGPSMLFITLFPQPLGWYWKWKIQRTIQHWNHTEVHNCSSSNPQSSEATRTSARKKKNTSLRFKSQRLGRCWKWNCNSLSYQINKRKYN